MYVYCVQFKCVIKDLSHFRHHSVIIVTLYSGTCLRWSLCKAATSLKQPDSLVPDSTKALESNSVEQPPLYNGHLELAHRQLFYLGVTVHIRLHTNHVTM